MYANERNQKNVPSMFSGIAWRYDFLNALFSFGRDRSWRKKALKLSGLKNPSRILDIATGSGAFAFEADSQFREARIYGIDPSRGMLEIAKRRLNKWPRVCFVQGNAEMLPFLDSTFDCAIVAFGVRNFSNLQDGLNEIFRVLIENSKIIVLEFSMPDNWLIRFFYNLYLGYFIPFVGLFFTGSRAYFYLRNTIKTFPKDQSFAEILKDTGFVNVKFSKFSLGVVSCYFGTKKQTI